jgi:hypothetical protein
LSRPIGSKNKPILVKLEESTLKASECLPVRTDGFLPKIHYDLNLSIRAFRTGNWKGLWELSKVDDNGKRTIIIDATSRQSMINMVNRQIMKMVIA